jgi:hypothetical protein
LQSYAAQLQHSISPNRETARVNRIENRREDHYTPEKFRMECVWENLLRPLTVRRHLPEILFTLVQLSFLELAIGFEPTTL